MKKRLLYFSECFTFAGCENVLVNLMSDGALPETYDVHYAYGYNSDYQKGVEKHIHSAVKTYPLRLITNDHLFYRIRLRIGNEALRISALLFLFPLKILRICGIHAAWNTLRLYLFFLRMRPDILHINNGGYPGSLSCRLAVLSARLSGVERIVFAVNNLARDQGLIVDRLLDGFVGRKVDYFVTASHAARVRLAEKRKFDQQKLIVISNTAGRADRSDHLQGRLRLEFGVKESTLIIGSAGQLAKRKGYHLLIDSINTLKDRLTNFKVFIFGEGEERERLERQITDRGLDSLVSLAGFKDDILEYMKDFDLFVLPSVDNEDLPYVILEAMMLGKPAIGTRVAGIPELIDHGKTGLLVDPSDAGALSTAIEALCANPERLREMGQAACQKYLAEYDYEPAMGKYLELYQTLMLKEIPAARCTARAQQR
ncbi:MAG TPA: glycosyltransferase family 4 protein [Syntrophorhabdales bacterium]|nr:glycosyltransferase family 4 protein [Syntrophorhabdales bacterium]